MSVSWDHRYRLEDHRSDSPRNSRGFYGGDVLFGNSFSIYCERYRMARRSATECASIFEICSRLGIVEEAKYGKARELLIRIVSMLTRMSQLANREVQKALVN